MGFRESQRLSVSYGSEGSELRTGETSRRAFLGSGVKVKERDLGPQQILVLE